MIKYKRILLKLSGEAFMGNRNYGIDEAVLNEYALQISENSVNTGLSKSLEVLERRPVFFDSP